MAVLELATGYIALVPSAKNITASLYKELGAPVEVASAQAGSRAGAALSGRFASKTAGMGKKLGKGIAAGLLGAGGIAIAGAGILEHIGSTLDSAEDIIRSKTGRTGTVLAGLDKDFQKVFRSVPASADDTANALAAINQRLGLTGKPLQGLTRQVLLLSHVTGTDLQTNISSIVPLLSQWGVKGAKTTSTVDMLFRASQRSGVGVGELASQLVGSGVQLRAVGFDLSQSTSLIALLGKAGLSASDIVPALARGMAQAAKTGKPAAQFFRDTFNSIKNAPNDTKAAGAALDVFGARSGPKLAALIRSGKLSWEAFQKSIAKGDTVSKAAKATFDWQEKLQILKNKALVLLAPIAAKVFNAIGTGADFVGAALGRAFGPGGIGTRAITAFRSIVARIDFGAIFARARAVVAQVLPQIQTAIAGLVAGLSRIDFGKIFRQGAQIATPLIGALARVGIAIVKLATAALPVLVSGFRIGFGIVQRVLPAVTAGLRVTSSVVSFLASHMATLKPILLAVAGGFVALKVVRTVQAGILGVAKAAGTAVGTVQRLYAQAGRLASSLRTGFDAAKSFASTVLRFGKSALTAALNIGRQTAAFIAQKAAALAAAVAQKAMAAATWLVNAAMDANPVTLIVAGIAALAVGVVLAYKKFAPFRAVVQAVGRAFVSIAKIIATVVTGAFSWIRSHWPLLLAILTGPFGLAVLAIKRFGPTVLAGIKTAFSAVVSFFAGLPARILSALGTAGTWLLDIGKKVLAGLVAGLRFGLQLVLDFYVRLPLAILSKLAGAAEWLLGIGKTVIGGLWRGIKAGWTAGFGFLTGLGARVLRGLGNIASWLLDAGRKVIGGLWRGIKIGWANEVAFWTGLPATILRKIGAVGATLFNKGRDILTGLLHGVLHVAATVWKFFTGLPHVVTHYIGDVGHLLFDIGKKIIEGLVDGMKSVVGKVTGFLGHLTKLIPFKKGPPSADKVLLRPSGQWIIQGLVDGFTSKVALVKGTLRSITSTIAAGVKVKLPTFTGLDDSELSSFVSNVLGQLPTAATAIQSFADRSAAALAKLHAALARVAAAQARFADDRKHHAGLARMMLDYKALQTATKGLAIARRENRAASDPAQFTKTINAQTKRSAAFAAGIKKLVGAKDPLLAKELGEQGLSAKGLLDAFIKHPGEARRAELALARKAAQGDSLTAQLTKEFGAKNSGIVNVIGPGPKTAPTAPQPFVLPTLAVPTSVPAAAPVHTTSDVDGPEIIELELKFPPELGLRDTTVRIKRDRQQKVARAKAAIRSKARSS